MIKVWHYKDPLRPQNAVYVGRPTKWGNPYTVKEFGRGNAVDQFSYDFSTWTREKLDEAIAELAGKDLVCWCAPMGGMPYNQWPTLCHAQVLAEYVNN